jgi:hypothetical protein
VAPEHTVENRSRGLLLLFQGSPISASQNSQSSRWQKLAKMKPTDFEKKQAGLPKQF